MNYSLLNGNYLEFKNQLDDLLNFQCNIEKTSYSSLEKYKLFYKNWENKIEEILIDNITPKPEILIDVFNSSESTFLENFAFQYSKLNSLEKRTKSIENDFKSIDEKLTLRKKDLQRVIDYISVTNNFVGIEVEELTDIQEKIDFIMEKLNVLFNDNYYSIKTIFLLNSVEHRNDEPEEIAEILNKRGYIIKKEKYLITDKVKISVKGASYIERKSKSRTRKDKKSNLDAKIDKIIEKLNHLGFGQEIIFSELEEMRDLQSKLPKKTWGQLLKGKLLDLALSEIISKETATFIFENLTNENFKLLK